MKVIWKFPIAVTDIVVHCPADAEFLAVKIQNGHDIVLYAAVDPEKAPVARFLYGVPTGGNVPDAAKKYLGTTQLPALALPAGEFVLHWYTTH